MNTLTRYLAREIIGATALVLTALLALFAFFDLIHELGDLGKGNYRLGNALLFVLLNLSGHIYALIPVAALIGTMFALSQLAGHSELTVMRVSGMSLGDIARSLMIIGLLFVLTTISFGEFITPPSERMAQQMKLQVTSSVVAQEFRSGYWVKDEGSFVNVQEIKPDSTLLNLRIYEFDPGHRLRSISFAKRGVYSGDNRWRISDVEQTVFEGGRAELKNLAEATWHSVLTPDILSVLQVQPELMSIWTLYTYSDHLRENRQRSTRYEIALWSKLIYPCATLVMMLLAIPFSVGQRRTGGVGGRIFLGVMLGLGFHFINRLFSHLGLLNNWPALLSALMPSVTFLVIAVVLLWRVDRR